MNVPLLETKLLVPPRQAGLVHRPRLIQRLENSLVGKLALVCAPPGFGKTTLLCEWAQVFSRPLAWLALDEDDNDPVRFLFYLIGAFQTVDRALGQAALEGLLAPGISPAPPTPGTPYQSSLASLLNDILAVGRPLALVLDDYHLVQAEPVHQVVGYLLEHQPSTLSMVIGTRHEPPLPLARLRARGQLVEIRERELRFTPAESNDFFEARLAGWPGHPRLGPEVCAQLAARTEGWAAGLQLAAISLQDATDVQAFLASFTGDNRHVADYLFEEVFRHQPAEVQDFLLHTAVLEQISAPLAEALTSGWLPDRQPIPGAALTAQAMLERIEAAQLFLAPLDHHRRWYRYHHLFRDLLLRLLHARYPGRASELHRRASAWHAQAAAGAVSEAAVEHAFAIPDLSRAARLVEHYGSLLIYKGRIATFMSWVSRIPDEVIFAHPYLCLDCGWAYAFMGQPDAALRYAQAGEKALAGFTPLPIAGRNHQVTGEEIRGDLTALRAYCARMSGDMPAVIRYSELALQQLPQDAHTVRGAVALNLGLLYNQQWDWDEAQRALVEAAAMALKSGENLYVAAMALSMQGEVFERQGRLAEAASAFQQAIELDTQQRKVVDHIPAAGIGYLGLAQVSCHQNKLSAAAEYLAKAQALAQQAGNAELLLGAHLLEAQLALLAGDLPRAGKLLEQTAPLVREPGHIMYASQWTVLRAELDLERSAVEAAVKLLASRELLPIDSSPWQPGGAPPAAEPADKALIFERLPEYLLLARLLILQDWAGQALQLLDQLTPLVEAGRSLGYRIETRLLHSIASARRKDPIQAAVYLDEALALSAPQNFVSPFIRLGAPLAPLLRQAAQPGGSRSEYAQDVQASLAVRRSEPQQLLAAAYPPGQVFEPLTGRERQVLRLLAAGLSSNQVAEELVLSVSTVRSYIKIIYNKLNAHSRDEAVAAGRSAGML